MFKIDIDDDSVIERSGNGPKGAWKAREQNAWIYLFERNGQPQQHPQKVVLRLDDGQAAYPIGKYQLHPNSLYIGSFSSLRVYPRLMPLVAAAARQAA